jgi:hypothetical protein
MKATEGILTELASEKTRENLDSVSARISRALGKYLTETFKNLDAGPVGNSLVTGAIDTLVAAETELRIKLLIEAVSAQAGKDIALVIRNTFSELSSPANKARLNSLMLSLFDSNNSDSLSHFINRAIDQIDFKELGANVSKDIFQENLRPEIDSIARTAVRAIFDEIRKDESTKGLFDNLRNIIFLGLGLLGLLLALLFWWNRRRSMQMNKVFVEAIENLDLETSKNVKRSVEREARQHGILKNVDEMLRKEGLLGRKTDT